MVAIDRTRPTFELRLQLKALLTSVCTGELFADGPDLPTPSGKQPGKR